MRLAHAVHHGGRGAQAVPVGLAHDVDPLLGRALGVGQHVLADLVREDLGAAARNRHEPRGLQTRDHVVEAHPLLLGDELDLGRREGVEVAGRVVGAQIPEQILIVGERQVRMDAALHEDARAVERQRLLHLAADLLERQQVAFGIARLAVEGAEPALVDADVGVVDVAVDVVGGDRGIVEAVPHLVSGQAQVEQVAVEEQGMGIAGRDATAGQSVVEDLLDGPSGGFQVHSPSTVPYQVQSWRGRGSRISPWAWARR